VLRPFRLVNFRVIFYFLSFILVAACGSSSNEIGFSNVFARATPPGMTNAAVYLTISNNSGQARQLVAVSTEVANKASIHKSEITDSMARMIPVDELSIAAKGSVSLEPGGLHVMLMGLRGALVEKQTFDLELVFSDGETIMITVPVRGFDDPRDSGSNAPSEEVDHSKMEH